MLLNPFFDFLFGVGDSFPAVANPLSDDSPGFSAFSLATAGLSSPSRNLALNQVAMTTEFDFKIYFSLIRVIVDKAVKLTVSAPASSMPTEKRKCNGVKNRTLPGTIWPMYQP